MCRFGYTSRERPFKLFGVDVLMDDTQTFLQQSVAGMLARHAPTTTIREWLASRNLAAAFDIAASQGWTGIGIAEEAGGQGGGLQELAVVAEQMGRTAFPSDAFIANSLATQAFVASGAAGDQLVGSMIDGAQAAALCVDARHPDELPTVSISSGRCTASVPFVLGGGARTLVLADESSGDAIRLFAVDSGDEGVESTARHLVDASRDLADVHLTNAPCRQVGQMSSTQWEEITRMGVILNCADSLGASSELLTMTTEYVRERRQFGVVVGSFQAVKHYAAQMLVDVEGMRSAVQYGSWCVGSGTGDTVLQASVAGAFCSRVAPVIADRALFLHGAIGYTWEHDLQLLFKRVKSNAALFGTMDWHNEQISASLGVSMPQDS